MWVTGSLGKGAAALALLTKTVSNEEWPCNLAEKENLIESFNIPQPRLDFGVELLSLANAAIDISDGLLADAQHIAEQSQSQLSIMGDLLPLHSGLRSHADPEKIKKWVLSGGDDYELLFTAAPPMAGAIMDLSNKHQLPCHRIGTVKRGSGVKLLEIIGRVLKLKATNILIFYCNGLSYEDFMAVFIRSPSSFLSLGLW